MEKVIMIPEHRYNKMLESYDKAVEELRLLREQIHESAGSGKIVTLLQTGDEAAEVQALEDIFEQYVSDPCFSGRDYPDPLKKLLEWFDQHSAEVPEEIGAFLMDSMADYEKRWFINGFRYAAGIWKAC
ncbi:MAG: hypothetical protein ACI39W_09415 [Brotaphodocola sp.]